MKKQLIIIGIVILVICIGLSGCNNIILTNIGDLQANPENYLGKEVKVKGSVIVDEIVDENQHYFLILTNKNITGNYYLTDIVKYGNISIIYQNVYYLEVIKAEAV